MQKSLTNGQMLVSGCADRDAYDTQLLYLPVPLWAETTEEFICSATGTVLPMWW